MTWNIIARQEIHNDRPTGWFGMPDATMTVPSARMAYDRGEIEMAQRRRNFDTHSEIALMVKARKRKAERTPYFSRSSAQKDNLTGVPSRGKVRR